MALKDWKKFPNIKANFQKSGAVNLAWINKNKNKNEIIYLNEFLIGSSFLDNRRFSGQTEWSIRGAGIIRDFKTRKEALTYAKQYMRTH